MSFDLTIEYAETEAELNKKVQEKIQQGYERQGDVTEQSLKLHNQNTHTKVFCQMLVKEKSAPQD